MQCVDECCSGRTIHAEPHSFVYQSNFEPPPAHPLLLIILSVCCTPINIILHPPTTRVLDRIVVVCNSPRHRPGCDVDSNIADVLLDSLNSPARHKLDELD